MQLLQTAATSARREITLVVLLGLPLAVMLAALPSIPQDSTYHALADTRTVLGIPNFLNVLSNVGFLIVGLLGLRVCASESSVEGALWSWRAFFAGVLAIAFGSAYYHVHPDNQTLVWDRLPMAIAFTALFSGVVTEHLHDALERKLLSGSLAVGVASIAWWQYADDLRLYAWVQFGPLLAILYLLLGCRGRFTHRYYLGLGLLAYVLAKIAELGDATIFAATGGFVSGHTLKHLFAALAPWCVYLMLTRRKRYAAAPH